MIDDHEEYAELDAAYVLGALAPAERRDYERHLERCERCRAAVAELAMLPGLLGRLDSARAFALLEPEEAPAPPVAAIVDGVRGRDRARRRRRGLMASGLAAAAILTAALVVPVAIGSLEQPTLAAELSAVGSGPLSASVELTSVGWGTRVELDCSYAADFEAATPGPWTYALWVVDDDGASSMLSTWRSTEGTTARIAAGTALELADISAVEVRSMADGAVLLELALEG